MREILDIFKTSIFFFKWLKAAPNCYVFQHQNLMNFDKWGVIYIRLDLVMLTHENPVFLQFLANFKKYNTFGVLYGDDNIYHLVAKNNLECWFLASI